MKSTLVLSLCLLDLGLLAAPAAAESLSLEQAVAYALEHNLDLQATDEQARAAAERSGAAQSARLPQVDVRYMRRRSDNPLDAFADKLNTRSVNPAIDFTAGALNYPDPSNINATELALRLPLYTGGRVTAAIRGAEHTERATRLRAERARQQTAFQTRQAYLATQVAAEGVIITEEAVQAAREHAQTSARLVREGRIVTSDKMTAELNLAAIESAREQAFSRQRRSLDELKLVMGMPLDASLAVAPWQGTVDAAAVNLAESEQRALAQRKDLQAGHWQVNAGRAGVDEARAAFRPQVSVVAANSWYDDHGLLDNKSTSIMGVVSMNIFSGGQTRHDVAAARHQANAAELQLQNQERSIRNEVRSAHSNLREALARYAIAAQSVDKARATSRLVKKRYGEGRTLLIEVLMAERILVEARNEELASAYYVVLSRAALRLAEGAPDFTDG